MKLFGNKTEAIFDWWSVGHIVTYYVITKLFLLEFPFEEAILILIGIGYAWEFIERALEDYAHTKKYFSQKEGWVNRYIGDIIADVIGFLFAWYFFR